MKKDFSKPKRRTLPTSRALLATMPDGRKSTATWVYLDYQWKCLSASKPLRFMRGFNLDQRIDGKLIKWPKSLKLMGVTWHWITPNYGRAITPPFMP